MNLRSSIIDKKPFRFLLWQEISNFIDIFVWESRAAFPVLFINTMEVMKTKNTIFIFLISAISLFGQEVTADKLYKYGRFDEALPMFLEELKTKDSTDADLNYKIGFCYLMTNIDKAKAYDYLKTAQDNGSKEHDILLELGQSLMHAEKFDDAIALITQYKNLYHKDAEKVSIADKYISFCNNGKELKAKALKVRFENLGDRVNSEKSETVPLTDFTEAYVLYTTNKKYIPEYGEFVTDIYTTEYKYGRWKRGRSVSSRINTSVDNEFLVGSAPNLEALLIRPEGFEYSGDLLVSYKGKRSFDKPEPFHEEINGTKTIESSGCLSESGDTLFFASDRDGGFGGFDIYYSLRIGDSWGIPQNLGAAVNTPYNEEYPLLDSDGKTLYFASEGHNSMGGYDIFTTKLNTKTMECSAPKNFGYPVNTTYDDYNISLAQSGRYGYVAQVRTEGMGEYDIYKVIFEKKDPYYVIYTGKIAVGDTASSTPIFDLTQDVKITVVNKENNESAGQFKANKATGKYTITLPPGVFIFTVEAEGYPKYEKIIDIPDLKPENAVTDFDVFLNLTPPTEK